MDEADEVVKLLVEAGFTAVYNYALAQEIVFFRVSDDQRWVEVPFSARTMRAVKASSIVEFIAYQHRKRAKKNG